MLSAIAAIAGCSRADVVLPPPGDVIGDGTWGGDNVALLMQDSLAHVHVGCTNGYFPAPLMLDENRRFNVAGRYVLRAYPVQSGPDLPARFAGVVQGNRLIFTVAVDDTVENRLTVLGPVEVVYRREPVMQICPICRLH
ncbi:MAG: hypothetical protein WEF86_17090 [Gemmatimonadota bacterium]